MAAEAVKQQIADCGRQLDELANQICKTTEQDDASPLEALTTTAGYNSSYECMLKTRRILKGHFGKIYALHWSADSKKLVSASQDGKLNIWNCNTTNKLNAIALRSSWVMACAFSPDEKMVACGGLDNVCSVYTNAQETTSTQPEFELQQHEGYMSCCRFIGNDKMITSSGDSTCILWDIEKQTPIKLFNGHQGDVVALDVLNESHDYFVSGSCDASVKLWDVREKSENTSVMTYRGHESDVNAVKFFPDGNAVGSGSDDSSCRLFDLRANRCMMEYRNDKVLEVVTSVAFSESGRFMFSGNDDHNVYCWDTLSGSILNPLEAGKDTAHKDRVSCLATSPDGKALCTGSWDLFLKIWA